MAAKGGEFSVHEMEELKRRLTSANADQRANGVAPSGAPAPVTQPSPQELFSRSSSTDAEALQLRRAIRVIQRHWLMIGFLTVALPLVMFLYDEGLNHPRVKDRVPAVLRAEQVYAAKVRVEIQQLPLPIGSRLMIELPVDKSNLPKILDNKDFEDKLREQVQARAGAQGEPGSTMEPPPGEAATRPALPPHQLRVSGPTDNVATIIVAGPHPEPLARVAKAIVPALNVYMKELRQRRFENTLEQYRSIQQERSRNLAEARLEFDRLERQLAPEQVEQPSGSILEGRSLLHQLKQERNKLELQLRRLENELALYRDRVDYASLADRLKIKTEDDASKVLIEGNPLRMEWAQLAMELTRLRARYTQEHPRILSIENDIAAIKNRLRETDGLTEAGELPPLPTPAELKALATVEDLKQKLARTELNLSTLKETIAEKEREIEEKEEARRKQMEDRSLGAPDPDLQDARNRALYDLEHLQNKDKEAARKIIDLEMLEGQLGMEADYAQYGSVSSADRIKPRVVMDVSVALIIGLLLGLGVAFLLESMDTHLHTPTDIYYHLRLNYLGVIPYWSEKEQMVIAPERPDSHLAEIYAHLCNNIRYGHGGTPEKRLLIASATQGEGKSTLAANLSVRYALEGNSVALIDADLRRPRGHKLLEMFQGDRSTQSGLSDYLSGDCEIADATYGTSVPGLSLVPAGSRVRNAAKLLGNPRMLTLLDEIERNFDIVILDCPAVLPVVDATILAPHMRGVLMVIAAEEAEIGAVRMALYRLQHVGAPMAGGVLNKVRERSASYTYYGYRYRGGYYYSPYSSVYGANEDEKDESGE